MCLYSGTPLVRKHLLNQKCWLSRRGRNQYIHCLDLHSQVASPEGLLTSGWPLKRGSTVHTHVHLPCVRTGRGDRCLPAYCLSYPETRTKNRNYSFQISQILYSIIALRFQPIRRLHHLSFVNTHLLKMNNNPLLQYLSTSCSCGISSDIFYPEYLVNQL